MSFQAVSWALDSAPDVKPSWVGVLVVLAECADEKGRAAWPSQPTVAYKTRKSERQVRADLRGLEEAGLIRRGDQNRVAYLPADRRPVVYDLAMERTRTDAAPWEDQDKERAEVCFPPKDERAEVQRQAGGSVLPSDRKHTSANPSKNHPEPSIHPSPSDELRMDGSKDQNSDETAPKEVIRSILEAHDVPRPQWPVNGLYSSAIAETRRLLDAGVSATDITDYVASRGSLIGPGIGAASPVLVARLREMPAIAAAPKPAPRPKPCIGGCVNGRVLCSSDCPPDMSKGVPMPCTGRHEPRGELCRVCAPRKAA